MEGISPQQSCTGPEVVIPGSIRLYRSWVYDWLPTTRPKWYSLCTQENVVICGQWGQTWHSTTMEAQCSATSGVVGECRTPGHEVPMLGGSCGIYGYYGRNSITDLTVKGTVRASGKILMGTHGARASYAEIESLYVGYPQYPYQDYFKFIAEALQRKYVGVPVYTDYVKWILDYPREDVSALLT